MAKKNRTNLKTGIAAIFYNNILGLIKGATSRDAFIDQADSNLNIISDANIAGGYMAIDMAGAISIPPVLAGQMAEVTVDISNLDTIDLAGITAPVINLVSSNPTEEIDNVINFPTQWLVEFRIDPALDITFNDAAVNAGNLHLRAPQLTCVGAKFGSLTLKTRASNVGELFEDKFIDQLN